MALLDHGEGSNFGGMPDVRKADSIGRDGRLGNRDGFLVLCVRWCKPVGFAGRWNGCPGTDDAELNHWPVSLAADRHSPRSVEGSQHPDVSES